MASRDENKNPGPIRLVTELTSMTLYSLLSVHVHVHRLLEVSLCL